MQINSKAALEQFFHSNKLLSIIRGHEVQEEGYKLHNWGRSFPLIITVFSAPNYCDIYRNKGAIVVFNNNTMEFIQFSSTMHPYILPNYMDAFIWSIPYVEKKVTDMLLKILNFAPMDDFNKSKNFEKDFEKEEAILQYDIKKDQKKFEILKKKIMGLGKISALNEAVSQEKIMLEMSEGVNFGYGVPSKLIFEQKNIKNPQDIFQLSKKYDFSMNEKSPFSRDKKGEIKK